MTLFIRLFHRFTHGLGPVTSAFQILANVQLWWTWRWAANQLGQSGARKDGVAVLEGALPVQRDASDHAAALVERLELSLIHI